MKYRALGRRYGKRPRKGLSSGSIIVDIECDTPAGYRWWKKMAAESGYGQPLPSGGWVLIDEPDNLPRFWETLEAAGGRMTRR
jgi:hypothetical protein